MSRGEARREAGGPEGLAGGVAHGGSGLGLGRPAALWEADWELQAGVAGSCMAPQDLAGWEAWGGAGRGRALAVRRRAAMPENQSVPFQLELKN